jgi:hypothetical protein
MGFIGNLAKGFVRSAVNQVGRDTGRVISRKLYTTRKTSTAINKKELSENDNREDLLAKGYKIITLRFSMFAYFWIFIISLIPLIGSLIWLYKSIQNFIKTKTDCYTYETRAMYARDRRYRTGARYEGSYKEKVYFRNKIEATKKERKIYITKGFIALFLACALYYFYASLNYTKDVGITIPNQHNVKEITVINATNGLNLRKSYSNSSEIIKTIAHNSIVDIIQLKDSTKSFNETWVMVQLHSKEKGWVWGKYILKKSP